MTLTLQQHLAAGYDHYARGLRTWTPRHLADAIQQDDAMRQEANNKLAELNSVMGARGRDACFVTRQHHRILSDALRMAGQLTPVPQ